MTKWLLLGLPLLFVWPLLAIVLAVGNASVEAAMDCRVRPGPASALTDLYGSADPEEFGALAAGSVRGRREAPIAAAVTSLAGRAGDGDVISELTRVRLPSGAAVTAEQARNAITLAQVARDLDVPEYGLQIAVATALQESRLVNLDRGDRDSAGLFQQRPSQGWGSRAQVRDPRLASRAFFGRARHTSNPGLLDIPNWANLPLTDAAQAVQHSAFPDAYAPWSEVAGDIAGILGSNPDHRAPSGANVNCPQPGTVAPVTLGTFNLLGAGHTDGDGGHQKKGYAPWGQRLPRAIGAVESAGMTIAGLQEVHRPQATALRRRYSQQWGMYPRRGMQNKVIWDRNHWRLTAGRLVKIPYFHGQEVGMPLAQFTGTRGGRYAGQSMWVWSVHNPASTRGNAVRHRAEALRRQLATMTQLADSGVPAVILGDFNDARDGERSSHCVLTPELLNAFGGSADPCRKPERDAPIDHIYGANLTWASARVVNSPRAEKLSDHPLVAATTSSRSPGCALGQSRYDLGPVKPELERLVSVLGPRFAIETVGGYRESARDPGGHPAGYAADFMVPTTAAGRRQADQLAAYARNHARALGIDYIIWWQRIWSTARSDEGWRRMPNRGGDSDNHRDHVHISLKLGAAVSLATTGQCDQVVYPVPARFRDNDARNWHQDGSRWSSWHTGTDFAAPCGTPVYAAHGGTVQVDTTQRWAGRWLVKVNSGPGSVSTWYAHLQQLTVTRGELVAPGQQIGMVGTQGNSSGCHLHFEVHLEGGTDIDGPDNVDPSRWLAHHVPTPVA